MAQPTEQGATPEPTAQMRPGKTDGQAHELTVIVPLKPGGADRTRERAKATHEHEARVDAMLWAFSTTCG